MRPSTTIAFKEWAVVVEALAGGEQVLILRKGGIHEDRGEFRLEHREFWLFPTHFHETESQVIPSKRPAVRVLAANAGTGTVEIQYYAVVEAVHVLPDFGLVQRLQGRHIWGEPVLRKRFEFGREPGLQALVARIYRRPVAERLPLLERYGGCKSWVELDRSLTTAGAVPVMETPPFEAEKTEIAEMLSSYAVAHL